MDQKGIDIAMENMQTALKAHKRAKELLARATEHELEARSATEAATRTLGEALKGAV